MAAAHVSILVACAALVAAHPAVLVAAHPAVLVAAHPVALSHPCSAGLPDPPAAAPAIATAAAVPSLEGCRWIASEPAQSPAARVRVIDLWGPWSGESTASMPRLSRLAREHAQSGVSVCGLTREMPSFDADRIEDVVRRLGGRVTYPIGIAPQALFVQLMALSGRESPPATLVTDASGTLLAACTPAELEHVLVRVLAGTWGGPSDMAGIRRESSELDDLVSLSLTDPSLAANQLERIADVYPHRQRDFASRRIVILLRAGRSGDATAAMRSATDEWTRLQDAHELTALATLWIDPRINVSQRDMALAAAAAEAAAHISGDLDPNPWLLLMRARIAAGDLAGARAAGERAMSMGDARMQARVAQMLSRIPALPEDGADGTGQQSHPH